MLLQAAQRDEVATIAIGDLGNEAGLGLVTPVVRELHRYGAKCLCPCGAGLAVTDRADVTVIGQVSNWAAYAIAALLAVIKDEPAALHRPQLERALLQACIGEGAIDGYRMMPCFSCDDVDGQIHMDIVEILAAIAETALRAPIE